MNLRWSEPTLKALTAHGVLFVIGFNQNYVFHLPTILFFLVTAWEPKKFFFIKFNPGKAIYSLGHSFQKERNEILKFFGDHYLAMCSIDINGMIAASMFFYSQILVRESKI